MSIGDVKADLASLHRPAQSVIIVSDSGLPAYMVQIGVANSMPAMHGGNDISASTCQGEI